MKVSRRMLDDEDGLTLEVLKAAHDLTIALPRALGSRPDRERLAQRFERFVSKI